MIEGTDLSYGTRNVKYAAMHAAGIEFAINKLGQGGYSIDPLALTHRDGCISAGVYWSWYYFGDYRYPAPAQARKHVELLKGSYGFGQIGEWLDLEYEEGLGWGRPSGLSMLAWLRSYLHEFQAQAPGVTLGIYTNPDLIHEMKPYGIADITSAMPLYIAHWTTEKYIDYEPWLSWAFWQQAGDVLAPWATGGVDYDYCNVANVDELKIRYHIGNPPALTIEQRVDKIETWITAHGGW
jgi:GH25 family lysozyme M1 (1,4-beta-N-acetylmuramidase)